MKKIYIELPEDRQELKRLLGIPGPGRPDDSKRPDTTLQEIADRAKVSIGSVSQYFSNQEEQTSTPDKILKAIIKIITEKPKLLQRFLDAQRESAARVKRANARKG